MCQRMGRPPMSTIGLGRVAVSSLSRVPAPPARITAVVTVSRRPLMITAEPRPHPGGLRWHRGTRRPAAHRDWPDSVRCSRPRAATVTLAANGGQDHEASPYCTRHTNSHAPSGARGHGHPRQSPSRRRSWTVGMSALPQLAIVGAGGLAREIHWLVREINALRPSYRFAGYLLSDRSKAGAHDSQDEILGDFAWLAR